MRDRTFEIKHSKAINLIKEGKFELVDKKFLTAKTLLGLEMNNQSGYYIDVNTKPLISDALESGNLNFLPKHLLKRKYLFQEIGWHQRTLLIELTAHGYLHLVPRGLWTKQALLKKDSMGNNCLYYSCQTGEVSQIPKSILRKEHLVDRNQRGRNSMHQLCQHGHLDKLPKHLISEETLLGTNPKKLDPIDELYSYTIGVEKHHKKIEDLINKFSDDALEYLKHKEYIISHLSSRIIRHRRATVLSNKLRKTLKVFRLPN